MLEETLVSLNYLFSDIVVSQAKKTLEGCQLSWRGLILQVVFLSFIDIKKNL